MRLGMDVAPPSATSFKRFRANVRKHLGEAFVHERVLRLAQAQSLCQDSDLQVVDSTNTDCRGAILDTYNLIARAIGEVLRRLAEWQRTPLHALAERLKLGEYLARSVKGSVDVDWTQKAERHAFLTRQVRAADGLVAFIRSPDMVAKTPPPSLTEAVELLSRVTHQDVEALAVKPEGRAPRDDVGASKRGRDRCVDREVIQRTAVEQPSLVRLTDTIPVPLRSLHRDAVGLG